MIPLNQSEPPAIGRLAPLLGMDPSTLTAAVKPLSRRGLFSVEPDPDDARSRLLRIRKASAFSTSQALDRGWADVVPPPPNGLAAPVIEALERTLQDMS